MGSEEQACLVRARSDSENSGFGACTMAYTEGRVPTAGGEPGAAATAAANNLMVQDTSLNNLDSNESGELIDYNDRSVLSQFHEDAIRQAGCGMSQMRLVLATGLALCGATVEHSVVPFILPSAEIEFCILQNEKSWLGMISLLGLCVGAAGWGDLSDRMGRRRTLLSCLAVNAVFSTIAAFMPTYGTFMMARFCSALGSGGIIPTVFSYVAEFCSRTYRARVLALLLLFVGVGGACAGGVASAVVPLTGQEAVIENKEHFSAWHRYLLLCTLPILASLLCVIWTQESPRYLLESGREVDALQVYQSVHSRNRARFCGLGGAGDGGGGGGNGVGSANGGSDYRLGELELPGKRAPMHRHRAPSASALQDMRHSIKTFWQAFFQLFSGQYIQTTVSLSGTLFFAMFVHYAISAYAPSTIVQMETARFDAARRTTFNETFENAYYNSTIENVEYVNTTFANCTFRDMFMSHVQFRNCSFYYVTFSNVKTSFTSFKGTLFVNSSLFETDVEVSRDMDAWCVLKDTVVRGMRAGCQLHSDLTSKLTGALAEQNYVAAAHAAAVPFALLPHTVRPLSVVLFMVCLCTPGIYFVMTETAIYILEAVFKFLLTLAHFQLILHIVESYPTHLRCTAHGFIMSLVYAGGMIASSVYSNLPDGYIVATLVTAVLAVLATVFSLKVQDSSANLL